MSGTSPLELDLLHGGKPLPPIPAALVAGRDHDLLRPLRFLAPGTLPSGPPPAGDRRDLAAALATANIAYGHPAAERLAARLADPATRVVVTGQQPGLYGGPLLTLTKMLAALRWAEAIEASGEPAVAVFWVATEDHDWSEATRVLLPGKDKDKDGPRRFDLGPDPQPLLPVGMRTFGPPLAELEAAVAEALAQEPYAEDLALLRQVYHGEARFGDAFCGFITRLLGERAPLLLDAQLPALKELQRPLLRRLVERRAEVDAAIARAEAETERRGYPLQVKPQPGVSPLFLLQGGERRRIEWQGDDHYRLRGQEGAGPVAELLQLIDAHPERVSPGVLARPGIQDTLLGTTLQVMGPAETSYLAQAAAVYPLLGEAAPWTTLRPQILVVEERQEQHLAELGVSLAEIVSEPLDRQLTAKLDADFVAPVRAEVARQVALLGPPIVELDASLERPWQKTAEQVDRALEALAGKVAAAVARRHETWQRRLAGVHAAWLPEGTLQERVVNLAYFLARYGEGFAREIAVQLDLAPDRLQAIRMTPAPRPAVATAGVEEVRS